MALLLAALASLSRTRHRLVCYPYVEKEWWPKASNGALRSPTSSGSLQILQPIDAGFVSLLSILRKTASDDSARTTPRYKRAKKVGIYNWIRIITGLWNSCTTERCSTFGAIILPRLVINILVDTYIGANLCVHAWSHNCVNVNP